MSVVPHAADPGGDAVDVAYRAIRQAIVAGEFAPGSRLPEERLCALVGVSRTPIRQALRQLEHQGHVELHPRRGAWVSSWTPEDVAEVYGARAELESFGARLAARKIGASDLRALEEGCVRMEALEAAQRPGWLDELGQLNNDFHAGLLEATGNRRLRSSLAAIVETPLILRVYHAYDTPRRQEALRQHREILAALTRRDPEWAAAAMRAHVLSGRSAQLQGA